MKEPKMIQNAIMIDTNLATQFHTEESPQSTGSNTFFANCDEMCMEELGRMVKGTILMDLISAVAERFGTDEDLEELKQKASSYIMNK
jgi:hypothetical protein